MVYITLCVKFAENSSQDLDLSRGTIIVDLVI